MMAEQATADSWLWRVKCAAPLTSKCSHFLSRFFLPLAPSLIYLCYVWPLRPVLSYAAFVLLKLLLGHSTFLPFLDLLVRCAHHPLLHDTELNSVHLGTVEQSELMEVQPTVKIETFEGFTTPRTGTKRLAGR